MPKITFLITLLLVTFAIHHGTAWRSFDIIMHNVSCHALSNKVKQFDCAVGQTVKNLAVAATNVTFNEDVTPHTFGGKLQYINANGDIITVASHEVSACEMLQGVLSVSSKLMEFAFKALRKPGVTNIPEKCPFYKNKLYYIKNFIFDPPPYTPSFKFVITAALRSREEVLMQAVSFGEFRPKATQKRNK